MKNFEINFSVEEIESGEIETITVETSQRNMEDAESHAYDLINHGSAEVDYLVEEEFSHRVDSFRLSLEGVYEV